MTQRHQQRAADHQRPLDQRAGDRLLLAPTSPSATPTGLRILRQLLEVARNHALRHRRGRGHGRGGGRRRRQRRRRIPSGGPSERISSGFDGLEPPGRGSGASSNKAIQATLPPARRAATARAAAAPAAAVTTKKPGSSAGSRPIVVTCEVRRTPGSRRCRGRRPARSGGARRPRPPSAPSPPDRRRGRPGPAGGPSATPARGRRASGGSRPDGGAGCRASEKRRATIGVALEGERGIDHRGQLDGARPERRAGADHARTRPHDDDVGPHDVGRHRQGRGHVDGLVGPAEGLTGRDRRVRAAPGPRAPPPGPTGRAAERAASVIT